MHISGFLHKTLSSVMHKKRRITLALFVMTALKIKKISLTELGRGIELSIQERSGIRRADRFLGNKKLHKEREAIYKVVINKIINGKRRPEIIVDWSNIPNTNHHTLRAALVAKGRALTLYEEVHPEKKLGNEKVQNRFLDKLKTLLFEECRPIIVTDGGFHNEWFRKIERLGWDYLGRIRAGSGKKFCYKDSERWENSASLCKKATATPRQIGQVNLGKKNPIETNLYLFKGKLKRRKLLNRSGKKRRNTDSLDHGRAAREPWIIATSLTGKSFLGAKRVIKIYKKRMTIEEGFRDLKSSQYGFGFEKARSKEIVRIEALLLIAMLAGLIAWLIGWIIEGKGLHYQFQSNTVKRRRVLSLFFLGCRAIKKNMKITIGMLDVAIRKGVSYAEQS